MQTLFLKSFSSALRDYRPYKALLENIREERFPLEVNGTQEGFLSLLLSQLAEQLPASLLVVVPTEKEAEALQQDLSLFSDREVRTFPWWGCVPYGDVPPLSSVFAERVHVLTRLLSEERLIVISSLRALLGPLPDPEYLSDRLIRVRVGDEIDFPAMERRLAGFGYLRVPRVTVRGEFAVRGEVIDAYVAGREEAVRIVSAFDQIEEIRLFNPNTQGSTEKCREALVFPVREVLLDEGMLERLEHKLARGRTKPEEAARLAEELGDDPEKTGIELFYPLCFEKTYSLLDYLPDRSTVAFTNAEMLGRNAQALLKEHLELYGKALAERRIVPRPKDILCDFSALTKEIRRLIRFPLIKEGEEQARLDLRCDPPRSFFGNFAFLREELENLLESGYAVWIFAVYPAQAERLKAILGGLEVETLPLSISRGFVLSGLKILVLQESEIFGRKKRIPRSLQRAKSTPIDTFVDLDPGDYVVHINYGIGLFRGIQRMRAAGSERDYIQLEYAEQEMLYIPIEQVNLVQKYIVQDGRIVRLDRIGGKSWENRKKRVRRSVEDLAKRLLTLYAKRRSTPGHAFGQDTDWQNQFEAGFPYQETEDQLRCIQDVKADMEQPFPMDRLVCGDVGYGKTEIALRASFKAVMDGKQVALLAPTTILVEQHYETFLERFQTFPVRIEMLSRFKNRAEQRQIVRGLEGGGVDVVIGTHRILQRDVRFKNLGLLVVDEEQRFGVKHKEILKEVKANVDCLTLTATPIPRTLHMSLMKIRDMSILNTPPPNRQPIETYVMEFNQDIVARAVRHEVTRDGQVYYLHNRVKTIPEVHLFLRHLLPEVSIQVAHGKMESEDLEDIMHRFIHKEFQVLLSTTIIENGLDIPNVNTIIIDRADMFGVAQLYQLKGRVGRSDIPATAYLLYPEKAALTELAMKRLKIISDFTELGSGFKIALKDLEIRGAGNLLGREQSGDILAVGFDMYVRLLDNAIVDLQDNREEQPPDAYLELEYSGYIPDSYIPEPMEKMEIYKKIAAITTDQEHDQVYAELEDRFGPLPDEVLSILSISEIRIICRKLFISSMKEKDGVVTVEFARISRISADRVVRLIQESGGRIYLSGRQPNCLFVKTGQIGLKEKSEFIRDRLSHLA